MEDNIRSDLDPAVLLRLMVDHTSRWDEMLEMRVARRAVHLTYTPCMPSPAWYGVTQTSMRRSRGLGLIGLSLASDVARWLKIPRSPPPSRLIATFVHPSIHPHSTRQLAAPAQDADQDSQHGLLLRGKKLLAGSEPSSSKKRPGVCLDLDTT